MSQRSEDDGRWAGATLEHDDAAWLEELSKRTGASVEKSDLERLGQTNPDDRQRLMDAYEHQYARRGASGQTGSGKDGSEWTAAGYGSGRNETADDGGRPVSRAGAGGSSVASAWLGGGGSGEGGGASSLFPDWYEELLTRQQTMAEQQQAENKARGDALYSTLNERATQGLAVDKNNPAIRQQADAYAANTDRARRNYISDVAEASGPLANIRGEERMAAERYGNLTGTFEAELIGRELQAKRDEIAEALRMQGAMLSGDQQRALAQQLAMLDQAIAEAGVGLQARGQDINAQLGNRGLDVTMRGQDLGMDQFLRQLAQRSYEWDSSPMGW